VAAIHLAGVRGEPCGAVRWTVQRTVGEPVNIFMYFNIEINILD